MLLSSVLTAATFSQDIHHSHLQEFVVSGSRWEQVNETLPMKISILDLEKGSTYNPQTTADLLGLSGEVFIQKSQYGGGSPMIRGFSTNRLMYSIDGVRMNNAIFRSGNLQNVISLDAFAIEHSEILFGPGSVSYGSDAIGGAMVFTTLRPRLSSDRNPCIYGSATARTATASSEQTLHIHAGAGWKKWAFLTSFTTSTFEDLKQGTHGPRKYIMPYIVIPEYTPEGEVNDRITANSDKRKQSPSGYSQHNFMQKVRFAPNTHWDIEYAFHFSETSEYSRYDRHQRMRNDKPRYAEWNYGPQLWIMNHLRIEQRQPTLLYDEMRTDIAIQRFEESRISRELNNPQRDTQSEKVDAWSANIDFRKMLYKETLSLSYGLEYVQNNVYSHGESTEITTGKTTRAASRYPHAHWYSAGAYIQAEWHIGERVNAAAGLRYNHYYIDNDFSTSGYSIPFNPRQRSNAGSISGNLGINWRPTPQWILRMNYARGFRAPNVDDMGKLFDSVEGHVTVPNPSLRPEYADNIEIGITKKLGNTVTADITAYYTHLDNAIVRRNHTFNGNNVLEYNGELCTVQALQNAAVARVWGIQGALDARFAHLFYANARINHQYGREELDNGTQSPSRHAPPLFGRVAIGFDNNRLCIEAFSAFQAECSAEDMPEEEREKTEIYALDADGKAYSPAWFTLNMRSTYRIIPALTLNVTLENITDKRYRPYSSGISAAGRNMTVSLTYKL